MAEKYSSYQVRIKDNRQHSYSYRRNNSAEYQKQQEKYMNDFYELVNKIVDAGSLIDPGKYFIENSYFNIRATEEIAQKVGKLSRVESIQKG
jgi:hypothetical protein